MSIGGELEELLAPMLASKLGVNAAEGPEQMGRVQQYLSALDDPAAGLAWLSQRIATLPPTAGSWVGVLLGGLVEQRQLKADVSAPYVVEFFRVAVHSLTAGKDADEWKACSGLLGPAVITQLVADQQALESLRSDVAFMAELDALGSDNAACHYVLGLTRHRSGELVVLDPGNERALLVNYANVGSCFHFFTLLQSVLPPDWSAGRSQLADTLAVAWGESALTADSVGDLAWFHYSQPTLQANIVAMVPGEATLDVIGSAAGQQVLAVFPAMLAERSWAANFYGPHLKQAPPWLRVERELTPTEVHSLLMTLRR